MKTTIFLLYITAIFLNGCTLQNKEMSVAQQLIDELNSVKGDGILFGHQDDLAYGKNWSYVEGESDVKRVAGDYPAVFGWELGGIERGDEVNLDSVPFIEMQRLAIKAHQMGGINTYSWHPYSLVNGENSWNTDTTVVKHIIPGGFHHNAYVTQLNKLADFFAELKTDNNKPIPFIFRPWHEMGGSWFWWGSKLTTPEEYKLLFKFTIDYLRNRKGLTNMVTCYSPDGGYSNANEYLTWYPGDDYVDILGMDDYEWPGTENWSSKLKHKLKVMIDVAKEKGKLAILAETGAENIPDSLWFTQKLGKAILAEGIAEELSYVLLWRNDPKVHHFFAYEGHPAEADAAKLLSDSKLWLLTDYNRKKAIEK